ncbi:MAG: ROK family protein [Anaerolineae bacterium]|nr:ROK family protein [Anaerolineae bacterium]
MKVLGIDIGGSGIKGALVNTKAGKLTSERHRIATPESLLPEPVLDAVGELVAEFDGFDGPLAVGFPAVVVDGTPRTPFTAHHVEEWIGFPVAAYLRDHLHRPVTMLNDADAAGIAEMRFGHGRGQKGVVIILTLGTGIGSAVFTSGHLVPNTEFGKLRLPGKKQRGELYAAGDVRKRENLDWETYSARLDKYLRYLDILFTPQLFIVGGGISKEHDQFIPRLTVATRVVPARLRNQAGIIGAAIAAAEGWDN